MRSVKLYQVWIYMQPKHEDNLKEREKKAQGHVSTAVVHNHTHTDTYTHRGMRAHTHCLAAPGLLRNRIDGTRGPDCVNVCVTACVCVCVYVCMCICATSEAKHLQQ